MRRQVLPMIVTTALGLGAALVAVAPPAGAATDIAFSTRCLTPSANYRATLTTVFRYTNSSISGVPVRLVKIVRGEVFQQRWNGAAWESYDWATGFTMTIGVGTTNVQTVGKNPAITDSLIPSASENISDTRKVWALYSVSHATRGSCGDEHHDGEDGF